MPIRGCTDHSEFFLAGYAGDQQRGVEPPVLKKKFKGRWGIGLDRLLRI